MQKEFFNNIKTNLNVGEVLINCDLSKNYSVILQDEVLEPMD